MQKFLTARGRLEHVEGLVRRGTFRSAFPSQPPLWLAPEAREVRAPVRERFASADRCARARQRRGAVPRYWARPQLALRLKRSKSIFKAADFPVASLLLPATFCWACSACCCLAKYSAISGFAAAGCNDGSRMRPAPFKSPLTASFAGSALCAAPLTFSAEPCSKIY